MAATSQSSENVMQQCKPCRCGEGDANFWATRASDNPDKQTCSSCEVLKSGPLNLSSKGIGWTSWKKRWFILTRTSLVFFRSDPAAPPIKGSEPNTPLGGIDLNNSGSVVGKADKKLLTVSFPDGHDGRTFTLKADTSEDFNDWKTALETALAQAPSPTPAMGQNGVLRSDLTESNATESTEASAEQGNDKQPLQSTVVGRPILLALEDIDGNPSFLEKALSFIEEHGLKVEGILRQSADVEEVERRIRDYEQGKVEFSPEEDAHVVGDCIKYILRELQSSPVPAACCTELVNAYRTDRANRIEAIHDAIYETFPEPNRHLLQRILKMMKVVATNKAQNRMSLSALAACMAPLLLRPLLAGECEFEDNFNMAGDSNLQLLKAAAAANHAQVIVIILLEEYDNIFDDEYLSSEVYTDSEEGDVEDEELSDTETHDNDGSQDGSQDGENDSEDEVDDDPECSPTGTHSESGSYVGSDDEKVKDNHDNVAESHEDDGVGQISKSVATSADDTSAQHLDRNKSASASESSNLGNDNEQKNEAGQNENNSTLGSPGRQSDGSFYNDGSDVNSCGGDVGHDDDNSDGNIDDHGESDRDGVDDDNGSYSPTSQELSDAGQSTIAAKYSDKNNLAAQSSKRPTVWGRTSARKNLSMESVGSPKDDEIAIQKLENAKIDLLTKIAKEVKGNAILQQNLEKRKEALHVRRLDLERDVERLRDQLRKERELRALLESGMMSMRSNTLAMDSKTKADLEEVAGAEPVGDLPRQLSHQQQGYATVSVCESCHRPLYGTDQQPVKDQLDDDKNINLTEQNGELLETSNIKHADEVGKVEAQTRDSLPVLDAKTSQKHKTSMATKITGRFRGMSNEESTSLSDKQSLPKQRLPSQVKSNSFKPQDSIGNSSSEEHHGSKKIPPKIEDSSSASALTKLTNRLNFLKERRAQIVSELQSSDSSQVPGTEVPPKRTNSR